MNQIAMKAGISGHFTLIANGGKRGRVVLAEFDNMILDGGLDHMMGVAGDNAGYCHVGSGSTAVAGNQTALAARVATTNTIQSSFSANESYVAGPPAYKQSSQTYRFAVGAAAGNLTEVGVGWSATGTPLFSRALIVDGGGTPTTVTVLSDEQLDVVYTVRLYQPADVTGNINISGSNYAYVLRPAVANVYWSVYYAMSGGLFGTNSSVGCTGYTGGLGNTLNLPTGTQSASSAGATTPAAYTNGSYNRTVEVKADLNGANVSGGAAAISWTMLNGTGVSQCMGYQMSFSPNLPKDATKVLRLNINFAVTRAP